MKTVTHVIAAPLGLHARPAGLLVKLAGDFESAIVVTTSTGTADAKRIMALMRLGAQKGTLLTVQAGKLHGHIFRGDALASVFFSSNFSSTASSRP